MRKHVVVWLCVALFSAAGCDYLRPKQRHSDLAIGKSKLMGENRPTEAIDFFGRSIEKEPANRSESQVYIVFAYRRAMTADVAALTNAVEKYQALEKQSVEVLKQDIPEAAEILVRVLADQNRLQQDAVQLLTELGAPAVPKIVNALQRYRKLEVVCLDVLERMGPDALDGLMEAASNTSLSLPVRTRVIEAIDRIGDPKSIPTLRQLRTNDPERAIQMEAAVALYKMGETEHESEILDALDSDDIVSRRIAARTVSVLNTFPTEAVLNALSDPDSEVRLSLVEALDTHPDPSAQDPLFDILLNDPDERVKNAARTALTNYGESIAKRLIKELPNQEDWKVRVRIVLLLHESAVIGGINADLAYELDQFFRNSETHPTVKDEMVKLLNDPALPK